MMHIKTVRPTVIPTMSPMLRCEDDSVGVDLALDCIMLEPGHVVSFEPNVLTADVEVPHEPAPLRQMNIDKYW